MGRRPHAGAGKHLPMFDRADLPRSSLDTPPRPSRTFWTTERVNFLRVHAPDQSASWIGDKLGCSRNAVISKCQRSGIVLHKSWSRGPARTPDNPYRQPWSPERAAKQRERRAAARQLLGRDTRWTPQPAYVPPPIPANAPAPRNLSILEVGPGDCRWPVNDGRPYLFCGCAVQLEQSYCPFHYRRSCARVAA